MRGGSCIRYKYIHRHVKKKKQINVKEGNNITFTWIGGRDHAFSRMLGVSSTSAANTVSPPPIMRLMRQTMARCSGSYLALPDPTWMWQRAVLGGTGTFGGVYPWMHKSDDQKTYI